MTQPETLKYTYDQFASDMLGIQQAIAHGLADYDYIVGIARGGLIPAVMLSHHFDVPLRTLHWQTRDGMRVSDMTLPNLIQEGGRVLIVDDFIDSGRTMRELLEDWGVHRDQVEIAALFYNPAQDVKPDFYARIIDRRIDQRWISFWWEA